MPPESEGLSIDVDFNALSKDAKFFEIVFKHYLDLFTYHAAQRLSTFRYFYFAFSVSATAYATLLSGTAGADGDKRLALGAAVLAFATFLIVLAFARLDRRNEQIISLNERPLKQIQTLLGERFGNPDTWETFRQSDEQSRRLTTFGRLLPLIFFVTALVSLIGGFSALGVWTGELQRCWWALGGVGAFALAVFAYLGVWHQLPIAPKRSS